MSYVPETTYTETPARSKAGNPHEDGTVRITPCQLDAHTTYDPHNENNPAAELDELLTDFLTENDGVYPWFPDITVGHGTGDIHVTHRDPEDPSVPAESLVYRYVELMTALSAWVDWATTTFTDKKNFTLRAAEAAVHENWDEFGAILDTEITDQIVQFLVYGEVRFS